MPRLRLLPEVTVVDNDQIAARTLEYLMKRNSAAIDTETTGLDVMRDRVLFWSMATEDARFFLPSKYLLFFDRLFRRRDFVWYLANAKYDTHLLANKGIHMAGELHDIIVMDAMDDDTRAHGLKEQSKVAYDVHWGDFKDLFIDPVHVSTQLGLDRSSFAQFKSMSIGEKLLFVYDENPAMVEDYASCDAYFTYLRATDLEVVLGATPLPTDMVEGFDTLYDYFKIIEVPFTKTLYRVERTGMPIDLDWVEKIDIPMRDGLNAKDNELKDLVGATFNQRSDDEVAELLFGKKHYNLKPISYTSTGRGSTSEKDLNILVGRVKDRKVYQVIKAILEYRTLNKLHGTYVKNIRKVLGPDGRIHCKLNQTGARCMPAGELVLTNRGYLPVEDVVVGDLVIAHTGKPRRVTELSQHPPQPIFRTRLSNGLELRTTGNHQFYAAGRWIRADQLKPDTAITVHSDPEEWRPLAGWPYEVSSWGRVRHDETKHIRKLSPKGKWGHLKVSLARHGAQTRGEDRRDFPVHRLVRQAFGDLAGETRHRNGIAWDNTSRNLLGGTSLENRHDALKHGTLSQRRAGRTKLGEEDVQGLRAIPGQKADLALRRAKLTREQANDIKRRYTGKRGQLTAFSREFGITVQGIYRIVKGLSWKKPPPPQTGLTDKQLAAEHGVARETIRDIRSGKRWRDEDYITGSFASFFEANVVSVEIESPEMTYGLTVEIDHSHVTNGIVTHNTGRLSSSNPNLQNIPIRKDPFKIRGMFCAPEGKKLLGADYPQIQPRLAAVFAGEEKMLEDMAKGFDIHSANAANMYGPHDERVTYEALQEAKNNKEMREKLGRALTDLEKFLLKRRDSAKTVGLGVMFGEGKTKMAHQLGIEIYEAQELIERFFTTYPKLAQLIENTHTQCHMNEFAHTMLGRIRRLHMINNEINFGKVHAERRAGFNHLIQGSEIEVMKLAMLQIDNCPEWNELGGELGMTVHDELLSFAPNDTAKDAFEVKKALMADPLQWGPISIRLPIPVDPDGGIGNNWLEVH